MSVNPALGSSFVDFSRKRPRLSFTKGSCLRRRELTVLYFSARSKEAVLVSHDGSKLQQIWLVMEITFQLETKSLDFRMRSFCKGKQ